MRPAICLAIFSLQLSVAGLLNAQTPDEQHPVTRMNHLALQVGNLEKSSHFYMHVVGLDSIPEPFHDGRHVWLNLGNASHLHLIYNPAYVPIIPGKGNHLCFSVASVPLFLQVLQQEKIPYEDWPGTPMAVTTRVDGVHQVYLKDPDGYWIEINDARD